jgi:hypothetical protein
MSYTPRQLHDLTRFITEFVLAPDNLALAGATDLRNVPAWERTTHVLDLTLRYDPRVLRFAADLSDVIHESGHLLYDAAAPPDFETMANAAAKVFRAAPESLHHVTTRAALREEVAAFVAAGDVIEDGKLSRVEGHLAIMDGLSVANPTQVLFAAVARRHFASTIGAQPLDPDALYALIEREYDLSAEPEPSG